jgi:hypothetical protein
LRQGPVECGAVDLALKIGSIAPARIVFGHPILQSGAAPADVQAALSLQLLVGIGDRDEQAAGSDRRSIGPTIRDVHRMGIYDGAR